MKKTKPPRLAALGLACCASLAVAPAAHAASSGQLLVGAQVPDWAVGDEYNCSGTLVTPRVIITSAECTQGDGFFHRRSGLKYYGEKISYPVRYRALGNVAIFIASGNFGGTMNIETAPVASYSEQETILWVDRPSYEGGPMEFYATDEVGPDSQGKAHQQMRLVKAFMDMSQYENENHNGAVIPDGHHLKYAPAGGYERYYPNFLNLFIDYMRPLLGPNFTMQDIDDNVILTIGAPDTGKNNVPPLSRENGAGLFFRDHYADPRYRKPLLIGTSYGTHTHVRLSQYWPWVVKTLANRGLRGDALLLSRKVLGTGVWGTNDRKAAIGQIFAYDNPYSNRLEYFRLISPDANGRYGHFPINQKDDTHWEYLGPDLPDIVQATTPFKVWGARSNGVVEAVAGTIYAYNNPYTREVEYFRLKQSRAYGYFPVNKTSNADWTYLGTDLPTRALKYLKY